MVAVLALLARAAWAQDVGTVVEMEGRVDVGRGGATLAATIGAPVRIGDEIRTGRPGRARLVFQDDSVLAVGDDTHLVIDEHVFDPAQGVFRSMMRLLQGKVRALVSEYYKQPRAAYQLETPTAVAGVRGTEFVVVYDTVTDVTEVIGVSGRVAVHSVLDRARREVFVTAQEMSTVARGQYPTAPRRLDDTRFRQYLGGLEFVGAGRSASLTVAQPLLTGAAVPDADRVAALPPAAPVPGTTAPQPSGETSTQHPNAGSVVGQSPPVIQNRAGKLGIRF